MSRVLICCPPPNCAPPNCAPPNCPAVFDAKFAWPCHEYSFAVHHRTVRHRTVRHRTVLLSLTQNLHGHVTSTHLLSTTELCATELCATELSCSKLRSCVELSETVELTSFAVLSFSSSSFASTEAYKHPWIPVRWSSSRSAIENWWQAPGRSSCCCCRRLGCCCFFSSASIVGKHPGCSSNKLLWVDFCQVSWVSASLRAGIIAASDQHALSFRDVAPSTSLRKSYNKIFEEIAVFLTHFEEKIAWPYLRQVRFKTKAARSHSLS